MAGLVHYKQEPLVCIFISTLDPMQLLACKNEKHSNQHTVANNLGIICHATGGKRLHPIC